jgi:hypothetical protein
MKQASSFKMMSGLSKKKLQLATGTYQKRGIIQSGRGHYWLWIDGLVLDLALGERRVQLRTPVWQF